MIMVGKRKIKTKIFAIVLICTLMIAQTTFVQAGVVRTAAFQGESNITNSVNYSNCTITVSASCMGKVASGWAYAYGDIDNIVGCTYEFFDMDGFHENGVLVNSLLLPGYTSWSESNWFTNKTVAYSAVEY